MDKASSLETYQQAHTQAGTDTQNRSTVQALQSSRMMQSAIPRTENYRRRQFLHTHGQGDLHHSLLLSACVPQVNSKKRSRACLSFRQQFSSSISGPQKRTRTKKKRENLLHYYPWGVVMVLKIPILQLHYWPHPTASS